MQVFAVKRLGLPAAGGMVAAPPFQALQFRVSPLNPRPKTDCWFSAFHLASIENSAFIGTSQLQPGSPIENARRTELRDMGIARSGQFSWDKCFEQTLEVYCSWRVGGN
jgi:hypothetical protein